MMRAVVLIGAGAMLLGAGSGAPTRDSLGIFDGWGAFRDAGAARCYAIATPERASGGGRWVPFASVGFWPRAGVRGQLHIRLSRMTAARSQITLGIGERRFALIGRGADAWAPDRRIDAAIIAAMRAGTSMSVSARAATGAGFADAYALKGAATAIDAAALGCGRTRVSDWRAALTEIPTAS